MGFVRNEGGNYRNVRIGIFVMRWAEFGTEFIDKKFQEETQ
jgi:hypothetical protein